MRPSAGFILALVLPSLGACAAAASADRPGRETRILDTTDVLANRIVSEAAVCGYPGVTKTLGVAEQVSVTIAVARTDPRYQCLVDAMAAHGEDEPRSKPLAPP